MLIIALPRGRAGQLSVDDVPEPGEPGPGGGGPARAAHHAVRGTDLHFPTGRSSRRAAPHPLTVSLVPQIIGHNSSAEVGVRRLGRHRVRVCLCTFCPLISCGRCRFFFAGRGTCAAMKRRTPLRRAGEVAAAAGSRSWRPPRSSRWPDDDAARQAALIERAASRRTAWTGQAAARPDGPHHRRGPHRLAGRAVRAGRRGQAGGDLRAGRAACPGRPLGEGIGEVITADPARPRDRDRRRADPGRRR